MVTVVIYGIISVISPNCGWKLLNTMFCFSTCLLGQFHVFKLMLTKCCLQFAGITFSISCGQLQETPILQDLLFDMLF